MPDLVPVDHNPFAGAPSTPDIQSMTHPAEQPDPAQSFFGNFSMTAGSPFDPVHEPGTAPKDYLNELARNPGILAKNVEQASQFNFGGMAGVRGMKMPDTLARREAQQKGVAGKIAAGAWADPNAVVRLRELHSQGRSLSEMASELGVSRGTIAGKIDRLGLSTLETPAGTPSTPSLKFMRGQTEEINPADMKEFLKTFRFEPVDHDPFKE